MGRDKATLMLSGQSMAARGAALLSGCCAEVLLCGHKPELAGLGLRQAADLREEAGPLAGLEAGLLASKTDYAILLACDMPSVTPEFLRQLCAPAAGSTPPPEAIVPGVRRLSPDASDLQLQAPLLAFEPLVALYHRELLTPLQAFLDAGGRSARAFLRSRGERVRALELSRDEHAKICLNLNREEAWRRFEAQPSATAGVSAAPDHLA